ncbi:hypothetical protein AB5J56_11800 [Streptomyces sp. R21]|uniref:Secreted protein n=1 Tax=Streptomyces sp. R21 TaxID=3238627 RepID=A0AB39P6A8_9ACTN
MVRSTTVRFVLATLSAVLLALQLFAPTASFGSAHSTTHASGAKVTGTAAVAKRADEIVTCGGLEHSAAPTGPLRTRDRHRVAADSAPEPPARVLLVYDTTVSAPTGTDGTTHHLSRSSTAHSPAALQVFRC